MKKLFVLICTLFIAANVSAQIRKVGDVVYVNGVKGVVFEVSADGKHGKVISAAEIRTNWLEAGAWCSKLGKGWRLPSKKELLEIPPVRNAVNATLSTEAPTLINESWYWSSDVYDRDRAWDVNLYSGGERNPSKFATHYCRAVADF